MAGGRYYIRLLLTDLAGRTPSADLKTHPDGTVRDAYAETTAARGLLYGRQGALYFFLRDCQPRKPEGAPAVTRSYRRLLPWRSARHVGRFFTLSGRKVGGGNGRTVAV